jgi:hypothetical protein
MPSKAQHRSLLDAVVAAARFERGALGARKLRKKRQGAKERAGHSRTGASLAVAARELRRLASRSAALDRRRRQH